MNPFPVIGYHSPDLFCDRVSETNAIIQAIKNNRPINLISVRRIGKTALVRNVLYKLDPEKYVPIYIDLEGTDSLAGFINRFSSKASEVLSNLDQNWFKTFMRWASGIGASVSLDPITGLPALDINHKADLPVHSLDSLLSNFNNHPDKVFVVAFDEFQEVTKYQNSNTEGWVRSIMQSYQNVRFIFSGSEKTIMTEMFNDPKKPFYQITQPMHLSYIDRSVYKHFVMEKLRPWRSIVNETNIENLLDWCRLHTYYVQYFCNLLYEQLDNQSFLSIDHLKQDILESQKHFFTGQKNLLPDVQWQTLKAIAKRQSVKSFTSKEFLSFSGLAATSARRSVEALLEKNMLLEEEDGVKVYNVFLSRYLETIV